MPRIAGSWRRAYPITSLSGAIEGQALLERVGNWRDFLPGGVSEEEIERIGRHERTGRPLGNDGFVGKLEEALGRIVQRRKPGQKGGHKRK